MDKAKFTYQAFLRHFRERRENSNLDCRLRSRGSAAYKGIYALLMREGGQDFRTGKPITAQVFEDERIDIHHIFPKMDGNFDAHQSDYWWKSRERVSD